jgi:hypothetical protein
MAKTKIETQRCTIHILIHLVEGKKTVTTKFNSYNTQTRTRAGAHTHIKNKFKSRLKTNNQYKHFVVLRKFSQRSQSFC